MKNTVVLFFLAIVLSACSNDKTENITFSLVNNLDMPRQDAGFTITGELFEKIMSRANTNQFSITCNSTTIQYQLEDIDQDGLNDQLFLLDDFDAKEERNYEVIVDTNTKTTTTLADRTNIHFATLHHPTAVITEANRLTEEDSLVATYYQMEGPAWENDKVGFRNYFDQRNGIDIFGKRTEKMVLDTVGLEGSNYHELDEWGMDVLKVGSSLGAGAIALEKDGVLYRVTGSPSSYRLINQGALRSTFRLAFDSVSVDDKTLSLTHDITITAGKHYYQSHVEINEKQEDILLVSGIVNFHSDSLLYPFTEGGYEGMSMIYTHSQQAEDKAFMGMGLICHNDDFIEKSKAPDANEDIVNSYLMKMKIDKNNGNDFYFLTGWETQDPGFKDEEYYLLMMMTASAELAFPIELSK